MTDIILKQGDTRPPLTATLVGADGNPQNLTGVDVYVEIEDHQTGEEINKAQATIVDTSAGEIRYEWDEKDTETHGYYNVEFLAVYGSGSSDPDNQHFPNDGELLLKVDHS